MQITYQERLGEDCEPLAIPVIPETAMADEIEAILAAEVAVDGTEDRGGEFEVCGDGCHCWIPCLGLPEWRTKTWPASHSITSVTVAVQEPSSMRQGCRPGMEAVSGVGK